MMIANEMEKYGIKRWWDHKSLYSDI